MKQFNNMNDESTTTSKNLSVYHVPYGDVMFTLDTSGVEPYIL